MSLSWPESLSGGLFPGHCWLQARRSAPRHSVQPTVESGSAGLLRALEKMLDERAVVLRAGSPLSLSVSDSAAAITTLPWQDTLHRQPELEAYARICFENQGIIVDSKWVLHIAIQRYRSMGIAYAFPRDWLTELVEVISRRRLELATVLPITASAYFGMRRYDKDGLTLQLLREENRASALTYRGAHLIALDVEPATASGEESGVRLLRRVGASLGSITRVLDWSSEPSEKAKAANFIPLCLPEAEVALVGRSTWL